MQHTFCDSMHSFTADMMTLEGESLQSVVALGYFIRRKGVDEKYGDTRKNCTKLGLLIIATGRIRRRTGADNGHGLGTGDNG